MEKKITIVDLDPDSIMDRVILSSVIRELVQSASDYSGYLNLPTEAPPRFTFSSDPNIINSNVLMLSPLPRPTGVIGEIKLNIVKQRTKEGLNESFRTT